MHQEITHLRERSIEMLTGAMKNRKKKLNMIYNHDDMNNDRLADKVEKAGVSGEAGK